MGSFRLATVKMGSGELSFEDYLLTQFTSDTQHPSLKGIVDTSFLLFSPKEDQNLSGQK